MSEAPPKPGLPTPIRRTLETALIAGAGTALFLALHVPAGAILGAISFTAIAALAGRPVGWPKPVATALYLTTGFSAGSSVTLAVLKAGSLWPLSILALAVSTALMWVAGWWVFRRITNVDPKTAFYATAPGALSALMALVEQDRVDLRRVAVAQSFRLLILVGSAPFALGLSHAAPVVPHASPALVEGLPAWALAIAGSLAGWRLGVRLKWPAPVFLGSFIGSALLHASGVVGVRPSPEVLMGAAAALGALIGSRFAGIRMLDLALFLPASLVLLAVMAAISLPVGYLAGTLAGVGPAAGLLAFAPGSMEMMTAVALALNAHPAYVVVHHLFRTTMLMALTPMLAARWSEDRFLLFRR